MTDKLKPCPLCAGPAEIWRASSVAPAAWVGCMGRCSVLISKEYATDAEAIAAWNHRPLEQELVEALKELHLQALQSTVNDPSNEWGCEAIEKASALIAKAEGQS